MHQVVDRYQVVDPRQVYWRVLCVADGHHERSSALTHLVACAIFYAYLVLREIVFYARSGHTLAHKLHGLSVGALVVTFAASVVFHVYSTVQRVAASARTLDIAAIYVAMAVGATADLAIVTDNFDGVPVQTLLDPALAAAAIGLYFLVHRCSVSTTETLGTMFDDASSTTAMPLLFRYFHSDLEHTSLRTVGVAALTTTWILMVPAALANLATAPATVWIAGVGVATALLVVGTLLDTHAPLERALARRRSSSTTTACAEVIACTVCGPGCLMTSHAWWHVLSFASTCVLVAAREYALQSLVK